MRLKVRQHLQGVCAKQATLAINEPRGQVLSIWRKLKVEYISVICSRTGALSPCQGVERDNSSLAGAYGDHCAHRRELDSCHRLLESLRPGARARGGVN